MTCSDLINILNDSVTCYSLLEGTVMIESNNDSRKYLTSSFGGVELWKIIDTLEEFAEQEVISVIVRCTYVPKKPKDDLEKKKMKNQEALYGKFPTEPADIIIRYNREWEPDIDIVDNIRSER